MVTFISYAAASTLLTMSAFVYAWSTRHQFYPSLLFLTTHKLNVVILGNLAFFFLLLAGQLLKHLFLGHLSRDEVEDLVQQSKYAITETCLALTIFREELNMRVLTLFTLLLFIKIFHWLAVMRVEHIARTHGLPLSTHLRLASLLSFLTLLDVAFLCLLFSHLYTHREASVLLLFAFEFTILSVNIVATAAKYGLHLVDLRLEGRWQAKSVLMFYLELTSDVLRLLLYLVFFLLICTYYGLPLHLIRELCITFYNLRERVVKFIAYRRITNNMNERFPDATREELEAGDTTCIICREDMTEAKKLQCGHNFHFGCLRTWLERSSSCPTCRASIVAAAPTLAPNAAGAVDEPPPALPPLPPHLQAHLDALMRERGGDAARPAVAGEAAAATAGPTAAPVMAGAASSPAPSPTSMHRFLSGLGGPSMQLPPPPASSPRAHSHAGGSQPQLRLHPFLPFAPLSSSQAAEHKEAQSSTAALHPLSSPAPFSFGFPGGFPSPVPFASPHSSPYLPHPFLPHPSAFAPTGFPAPASPPPASFDASHLPVMAHHTLLLQTHMAMLESELRQVKTLWERQLELQEMALKHAEASRAKEERKEEEVKAEAAHPHAL